MTEVRFFSPSEVPILELGDHRSADQERQARYLELLRQSLEEHGFLVVAEHGVDLELLDHCYALSRTLFALPPTAKELLRYDRIDQRHYSNVGYFPFKAEQAVGAKLADSKEFFHVGPSVGSEHPMAQYYADNVWPEVEVLRQSFSELYRQLAACGDSLLLSIAELFGVERGYAENLVEDGNHILRTIHYPSLEIGEEAVWAAQHTGIQLLGLQPRTSHPGLEICTPQGEWIAPAPGFENHLLINIGEMLAHLLGGAVTPTLHRVVSRYAQKENRCEDRYAIVFFYHANPLRELRPVGQDAAEKPGVRVGDWLLERLAELKLF